MFLLDSLGLLSVHPVVFYLLQGRAQAAAEIVGSLAGSPKCWLLLQTAVSVWVLASIASRGPRLLRPCCA